MKYIKKYEEHKYKFKFKIGNYVIVSYGACKDDIYIIKDKSVSSKGNSYLLEEMLYDINSGWVPEEDILRIATPEEIENYKLNKKTSKYNL